MDFEKELRIKRGSGKIYNITLKDKKTKEVIDLTGYDCKYVIKDYYDIRDDDTLALDYDDGADIRSADKLSIEIQVKPEVSTNFPITVNTAKPLVLGIQISKSAEYISEEFYYSLIVEQNVLSRLY